MLQKQGQVRPGDHDIVAEQLGRFPRGLLGVARRCRYGYPQVIVSRPVYSDGGDPKVFPTLFWLSCPYLRRIVAKMESEGQVAEFQARLDTDREFSEAMTQAHQAYAQERTGLVPENVVIDLKKHYPGVHSVLTGSGVGGIRGRDGIKCLHTHLAHELAGGPNPVGRAVAAQIESIDGCATGQCRRELHADARFR